MIENRSSKVTLKTDPKMADFESKLSVETKRFKSENQTAKLVDPEKPGEIGFEILKLGRLSLVLITHF